MNEGRPKSWDERTESWAQYAKLTEMFNRAPDEDLARELGLLADTRACALVLVRLVTHLYQEGNLQLLEALDVLGAPKGRLD